MSKINESFALRKQRRLFARQNDIKQYKYRVTKVGDRIVAINSTRQQQVFTSASTGKIKLNSVYLGVQAGNDGILLASPQGKRFPGPRPPKIEEQKKLTIVYNISFSGKKSNV